LKLKQAGLSILLDFHYSDTWADPGSQTIPVAWQGLEVENLADSVYQYTKNVLQLLAEQNTLPVMVQIGNETNGGFLWDQGRVGGTFDDNWGNYAKLLQHGLDAVAAQVQESGQEIATMLHIAGVADSDYFFRNIQELGIEYDIIGISHYTYFHTKDLTVLENQLHALVNTFDKPIMIIETNYPWTLQWNDFTHNWVGTEEQLVQGYPATPEGQYQYIQKIVEILKGLPNQRGLGFCWWAPDLVAFNGTTSTEGSFMENLTTFDFQHKALPIFKAFREN